MPRGPSRSRPVPVADPFAYENAARAAGRLRICGIDEAGRGPLAGPVVAAAVILRPGARPLPGITDSKALGPERRAELAAALIADPAVEWSLGIAEADEIDALNILRATHLAMRRAAEGFVVPPDFCLVDGLPVKSLPFPSQAIVKGDALSWSIGAASILAKEHRDALMRQHALRFPQYGFERHAGYGTPEHLEALRQHGPCELHRRSFAPVRAASGDEPVQLTLF
ncbi:MAG: hypothetical protein RL095_2455 [Verrucomicrobiota bacterium]|jgi:ribonuclease HII